MSSCFQKFFINQLALHNVTTLSNEHFLASQLSKLFKILFRKVLHFRGISALARHTSLTEERAITVSFHSPVIQNSALPLTSVLIFPQILFFCLQGKDSPGQEHRQAVLLILLFTTTDSPSLLLHWKVIFPAESWRATVNR